MDVDCDYDANSPDELIGAATPAVTPLAAGARNKALDPRPCEVIAGSGAGCVSSSVTNRQHSLSDVNRREARAV